MKKISLAVIAFALPVVAGAQAINDSYLVSILNTIKNLINLALPIIIAAAVVYFVYGIAKYVLAGDEGAKEVAKDKIIYGIIALVVMVSVWGLVNIVVRTLGITDTAIPGSVDNLIPASGRR